MDTNEATADGLGADEDRRAKPCLWQLRTVYVGGHGIRATPVPVQSWSGTRPLGIGRRSSSPLSDPWLSVDDDRVSREHARLTCRGEALFFEDLQSRNGSWHNGARLEPGRAQPVADGDVLRVGDSFVIVRHVPLSLPDSTIDSVIGVSPAACALRCQIARVAAHDRAVLIRGETGTGKEVTAQAIHQLSGRAGELVAVNCAAIPATLAESQLFGVARGAFTGSVTHLGLFGQADRGTLFLDEVGELPADLQPKLLRALETRRVLAVGSQREVARDVRIVAATNRDLEAAMSAGQFREDLYARLAAATVQIPALAERREDILLLAQKFVPTFSPSPRLVAALLAYPFPRNIRELAHVVTAAVDQGEEAALPRLSKPEPRSTPSVPPVAPAVRRWQHGDPVPSQAEVTALLTAHRGNLTHIEQTCGYSRRQFRRWAEGYGIDLGRYRV
jgi:DNA-binding NtrC family response regulator